MGNLASSAYSAAAGVGTRQRLPAAQRDQYFCGSNDRFSLNWIELLCIPQAMGCSIVIFAANNPNGGEAQYRILPRLSHNEHVPRYQLHVVSEGKTKQWIIGHMYKTETHLRTSAGEFIRVQAWNLTCNEMEWVERRNSLHRRHSWISGSAVKARPTPRASDSKSISMTIATQAKLDRLPDSDQLDPDSERWTQTLAVNNKSYKLTIEKPQRGVAARDGMHRSLESMSVMRILNHNKKVCVARKQRFGGTLGSSCQPFLGVRISPKASEPGAGGSTPRSPAAAKQGRGKRPDLKSLLDTNGLMLLLLCLAWSEETISPTIDASYSFIHRMREAAALPDEHPVENEKSAAEEMKSRLQHIRYAKVHSWYPIADADPEDERPEDEGYNEDDEEEEEEEEDLEEDEVDDGAGVGHDLP